MIGAVEALCLGVIQGLTEYLPVSSSGHLVIAQHLFGLTEPALFFDITLHLGTLVAVVWYYWNDILDTIKDTAAGLRDTAAGKGLAQAAGGRPGFKMAFFVVLGTIPTGIIGMTFKDQFEVMFGSPRGVGVMLMVTGAFLLLTRYTKATRRGVEGMRWWEAVAIGLAQGIAITPGISRSGATIALALFLGVERETAARFSFFLFIPAALGAMALNLGSGDAVEPFPILALGFASSMIVGYFCLALLVNFVKRGRLFWFSCYLLPAGALTLFLIR